MYRFRILLLAFALSMGTVEIRPYDALTVGALAARAVEVALLRSVRMAKGFKGVPSAAEWRGRPTSK